MSDFIEKFRESLNSNVFLVENNDNFCLKEKEEYTVNVKKVKNSQIIIIKPSEMKSLAKYLNSHSMPKDCDFILIDTQKEHIFFIELKSKSTTDTEVSIRNQLIAGKKWFEHILFVTGLSIEMIKDFKIIPICIRVNNKMDYKQGGKFNLNNNIYKVNGHNIDLRNFYHNQQCHITFINFEKKLKK